MSIDAETSAVNCCEIFVSNIPAANTVDKLTAIFESKRVTGIADCVVEAVTYDINDSTCAIVKFTTPEGWLDVVVYAAVIELVYSYFNYCMSVIFLHMLNLITAIHMKYL